MSVSPFSGGASFHDFHHSNNVGAYVGTFTFWDHIMETDIDYYEFKDKNI